MDELLVAAEDGQKEVEAGLDGFFGPDGFGRFGPALLGAGEQRRRRRLQQKVQVVAGVLADDLVATALQVQVIHQETCGTVNQVRKRSQ